MKKGTLKLDRFNVWFFTPAHYQPHTNIYGVIYDVPSKIWVWYEEESVLPDDLVTIFNFSDFSKETLKKEVPERIKMFNEITENYPQKPGRKPSPMNFASLIAPETAKQTILSILKESVGCYGSDAGLPILPTNERLNPEFVAAHFIDLDSKQPPTKLSLQ